MRCQSYQKGAYGRGILDFGKGTGNEILAVLVLKSCHFNF